MGLLCKRRRLCSKNVSSPDKYIEIEYAAMRSEIETAHRHIFLTMQISWGFIGALMVVVLDNIGDTNKTLLVNVVMCILIPVICATALSFMLAESIRMQRAGDYICILERKVALFNIHRHIDSASLHDEEHERTNKCSAIELTQPLAFERWIRDSSIKKSIYGRAGFMLWFRFISFFLIEVVIFIVATFYQLFVVDNLSWIPANYIVHLVGAIIAIVWNVLIIKDGLKLVMPSEINNGLVEKIPTMISMLAIAVILAFVFFASRL